MPNPVDADSIAEAAASPASASADGQSAAAHSISEQIKADQYRKNNDAVTGTNAEGGPVSGWRGVRMARAVPPGAS